MNLADQAFLAVANLKITHLKNDLKDYEQVLELYNPSVPAFEKIIAIVEDLYNRITELEKLRNEVIQESI